MTRAQNHEAEKYGHESRGFRNQEWLCCRGPAANTVWHKSLNSHLVADNCSCDADNACYLYITFSISLQISRESYRHLLTSAGWTTANRQMKHKLRIIVQVSEFWCEFEWSLTNSVTIWADSQDI
jgi:hypothetical protein